LQQIGAFAILKGQVVRGDPIIVEQVVPNARITATCKSDGKRSFCVSGADGRYEFPPLPPGEYKVTVHRIGTYKPKAGEVDASKGSCCD
jgi:hypothetical protein